MDIMETITASDRVVEMSRLRDELASTREILARAQEELQRSLNCQINPLIIVNPAMQIMEEYCEKDEAGTLVINGCKTGRFKQQFMSRWREFDLGKFAVSSIRVYSSDTTMLISIVV